MRNSLPTSQEGRFSTKKVYQKVQSFILHFFCHLILEQLHYDKTINNTFHFISQKIYLVLFFNVNLLDNCLLTKNFFDIRFLNTIIIVNALEIFFYGIYWWNTMACLAFVCCRTSECRDCVIFNDLRQNFQCCKSFKDYPFYHIRIPYLYPASYFDPSKSAMRLSPSYGCLLIDVSAIKKAFGAFYGCQCLLY